MLSINPNRVIIKGFLRASMIDKLGDFRLLPLSFVNYCHSSLKNEISDDVNAEYNSFIESQNVLLHNSVEYNNRWNTYSKIRHLSVELSDLRSVDSIVNFVNENLCDSVDFIIDRTVSQKEIINLLDVISENFYCRVSLQFSHAELNEVLLQKINNTVNICSAYFETVGQIYETENEHKFRKIFIRNKSHAPNTYSLTLRPHSDLVAESKFYHTYLNKRAHIDADGYISRFQDDPTKFGKLTELQNFNDFLQLADFDYYWRAKKENCDVCKHCEFRHICVDFRVPIKRKEAEWYHENECDYNPFCGKWIGELGYKTLLECGIKSDRHGFSIDSEKIEVINKELWGD